MTRINVVTPEDLHPKHLLAEYRELPRVFKLARLGDDIPETYRLGPGHVKFFFDKLEFLYNRQCRLVKEMQKRGFNPKFDPVELLVWRDRKPKCWNDYVPTLEAIRLNNERIHLRLTEMKRRNNEGTSPSE